MPAVKNCEGVVLPSGVRSLHGRMVMAMLLSSCPDNARILLANLFQSSRSTFSWESFPSFFAFKAGMSDTQILALGG